MWNTVLAFISAYNCKTHIAVVQLLEKSRIGLWNKLSSCFRLICKWISTYGHRRVDRAFKAFNKCTCNSLESRHVFVFLVAEFNVFKCKQTSTWHV